MNALMDETTTHVKGFELNASLNGTGLNQEFRQKFWLHIENILSPVTALALYELVSREVEWRSFLVADERLLAAPAELRGAYPPEVEKELADYAYAGAAKGFAYLQDANRLFAEDVPEGTEIEEVVDAPVLVRLGEFVNSQPFLEFVRAVIGVPEISRAAIRATRFRPGHFEMFHNATRSADKSGKRIAEFSINLTPEWKAEWGGLLEFRRTEPGVAEAYVPTFNSLDIFGFPVGHWISCVAPFAGGSRLAVSGRLYAEPPKAPLLG